MLLSNPFALPAGYDDPALWQRLWRLCHRQALTGGQINLATIVIGSELRGDVLG